jgi:hypothetical protein
LFFIDSPVDKGTISTIDELEQNHSKAYNYEYNQKPNFKSNNVDYLFARLTDG